MRSICSRVHQTMGVTEMLEPTKHISVESTKEIKESYDPCSYERNFFSFGARARSTIVEKTCEKFWFYSHDVIDRPSVRTYVHPSML